MSDYRIVPFVGSQRQWTRLVTYRFASRVAVNERALVDEIRRRVPRVERLKIEPVQSCQHAKDHHYMVSFGAADSPQGLERDHDVMSEIGDIVRSLNETRRKIELYESLTVSESE